MKAAVYERYGPPEAVEIREVPTPVPGHNEILVRMRAASVSSGDTRSRALRVPRGVSLLARTSLGLTRPKRPILGFDMAGDVAAVGSKVTRFRVGDRVAASAGFAYGCHAEYRTFAEGGAVAIIPAGVSYEAAVAALFGGGTALEFLKRGKLAPGEAILVNGASGAVGSAAVQIAKVMGAEVTGVASGANADLVRSLGADHVVDYTREDFAAGGKSWDVIMDTIGNARYGRVKGALRPGGRLLMVIADLTQMLAAPFQKGVVGSAAADTDLFNAAAFDHLLSLVADGKFTPVIDSTYPLEDIVAAHRRADTGRKRGSVLVTAG